MSKSVLITQSNYIPWKGYLDNIAKCDYFVVYDEMQFTKRDWRSRNYIKSSNGLKLLSIPTLTKGKFFQKINEVEVCDHGWRRKHWETIFQNYKRSEFFEDYADLFQSLYLDSDQRNLSQINVQFISEIMKILDIKTKVLFSKDFKLHSDRNLRLVNICKDLSCETYLTGPAAKNYMDLSLFDKENIQVEFSDYSNYIEYDQLHGDFVHEVSILDLIFNKGPESRRYLKF